MTRPDMTALWHEQQQAIKEGSQPVDAFLDALEAFVGEQVGHLKAGLALDLDIQRVDCPRCKQGQLIKRKGKKGPFWACNAYPACKASFNDAGGQPEERVTVVVSDEHVCPDCQSGLIRRPSKKNKKGSSWAECRKPL